MLLNESNINVVLFNSAIYEIFVIAVMYIFISNILELNKIQKRVFLAIFFASMFPLNMFRVIVQYYYEELTNKTIVILLIMFATTVIYISALKIITTLDYLHIFIADMGAQIIAGTFVGGMFILSSKIVKRPWEMLVQLKMSIQNVIIFLSINLITLFICLILKKLIVKYTKNFCKEKIKYKWLLWGIVVIFNVGGFIATTAGELPKRNVMITSIGLIICFIFIMYEISWLVRLRKEKQIKEENKILNIENAVMKEYYNTLEYQLERTRKFRHDIEKHMNVINDMIAQDEDNAEIENIAYKVNFDYGYLKNEYFCDNPILNSILINRNNECKNWNIRLDIDAEKFNNDKIKEIDLIALISNLFDNAIEECKLIAKENSDTQIKFKMKNESNNILITIDNSTTKKEILEKGVTTKSDKYAHGVGLEIVEEITKRYNGKMERKIQDNIYETHIILKTE